MKRNPVINVAIVENDAKFRTQLARWIGCMQQLRCSGACASGEAALELIPPANTDVVLMDLNLPAMSAVECVYRLKTKKPALQILLLTACEDSDLIFKGLQAGATGYLHKGSSRGRVREAILEVSRGGAPMSSHIVRKVVQALQRPFIQCAAAAHLTLREEEILSCVARGLSNKEISEELAIAVETARVHLKHIYAKLHVRCRTEAALKARGLIPQPEESLGR